MRAYLGDLDDRGFAASSAARRLSAIRQFHQFLVSETVRDDDPTGIIDGPKKAQRLPKVLSEKDVECADRDRGRTKSRATISATAASSVRSACMR